MAVKSVFFSFEKGLARSSVHVDYTLVAGYMLFSPTIVERLKLLSFAAAGAIAREGQESSFRLPSSPWLSINLPPRPR